MIPFGVSPQDSKPSEPKVPDPTKLPGFAAYTKHCAPCHGERGDGQGVAWRFLDPPPRDFKRGLLRLVSSPNGAPSGKDLFETIAGGISGTAMIPFAHIGEEEVWKLIDVVLAFRAQGILERLKAGGLEGQDLQKQFDALTTPILEPSEPGAPVETFESAARGLLLYRAHCSSCHGIDGRGLVSQPEQKTTTEGYAIRPRDFTRGVLKQFPTPANLFDRIRYGMPGTPMPAFPKTQLDAEAVWNIIHYLHTLTPLHAQSMAQPQSQDLKAVRLTGDAPTSLDDPRFSAAPAQWIPFAPFRIDEATIPGAFVQALVASDVVAFRLTIPDPTRDVPGEGRETPPDGIAVRITATRKPPVLPFPNQPARIDRALVLTGPQPGGTDKVFTATPRFENPESVCRAVIPPDRVGKIEYRNGSWHVVIAVRTEQAGDALGTSPLSVSFAPFDGSLRRGPMPVGFSAWLGLRVQ